MLQVVPSYLEVVLSYLELHPRELPDLRCVSVTGEALKKELTQRWFAAEPDIKLVNAYGLTETSDDTNHEVMDRVPTRERVPLGPPVNNVHVYVVDEHLSPVPLGAPGLIVFSGVCVGRGYVNDPDRTRLAYLTDPHREGQRLYLRRRLRPLVARGQAGVPRPPGHPGQDLRLPDRDRRDRERPVVRARVCATVPWSSPSGPTRASTWWPSTPASSRSSRPVCGTGWVSRCRSTWSRPSSTGGRACR